MNGTFRTGGDLSLQRTELLRRKLRERGIDTSDCEAIRKTAGRGPAPLSYSQRRLWFIDKFEPGSPAYNIPAAIRLLGRLDVDALKRSLNEVVRRHEALRTRFEENDGQPVQIVTPARSIEIPLVSLEELAEFEREAEARRLAATEAARMFDLRHDLMLRAKLLALSESEHVLLLVTHHIASDGWSIGALIREIAALYEAFVRGRPSPIEELPIQYADYAVWQLEWMKGEAAQAQIAYWKEKLSGGAEMLDLPFDRPRSAAANPKGALYRFTVPEDLTERLKIFGRRRDATLFMALLAGFKILLHRHTGQPSLSVGTSVAGRHRPETERLIGFFLNTLILRSDLSGDPSAIDLLERVRETALGAYVNQEIPVEALIEALQPERSANLNQLFQVMFIFQNTPMPALELPDLSLSLMEVETGTAKFDLTLSMEETGRELTGVFEYNADLFDFSTIERMSRRLLAVLEGMVSDPDRRISQITLMGSDETRYLLETLNDTRAEFPRRLCAHDLFEDQVGRAPDAIAVVYEEEQISYGELNARANQLAHYLKTLGARPETIVGLCVERSPEMITGLLGILKAGAAYAPIDPTYPRSRIAQIIGSGGIHLLLTQDRLRNILPATTVKLIALDSEGEVVARQAAENFASGAVTNNTAYVIYTSGSTGEPKGVMVTHRALVNHTAAAATNYELALDDRVLQFASLSFDASAEEIFPTLTRGATLVLRTDAMLGSVTEFLLRCEELCITALDLPTAYWHEVMTGLSADGTSLPASTRLVIIGGEQALLTRLRVWKRLIGSRVRLLNTYGPTEATIVATRWEATHEDTENLSSVPIGKPIANTQIYILDQQTHPLPSGAAGEIYIGGEGLASGYLKLPDLTADKFIPNLLGGVPGSRLYRTGDKARWTPDGDLQFLGRADSQVKIRGFRIELEEVERALAQVPGVHQSIAIGREDQAGDKRLIAYVVASKEVSARQIRGHLRNTLPDFMIPSAFVLLDEMPMTPSGKLDRQALPAPDGALGSDDGYLPPRSETERALASIWGEVLGLGRVGLTDNFFELGGHSLLATRVLSRVRERFQVEPPLRGMFEAQNLGQFAEIVEEHRLQRNLPPFQIERVPRGKEIPLSLSQERIWFMCQLAPDSVAYNVPRAVKLSGELDLKFLEQTFNDIVRRHEPLRTCFPATDGKPVQIVLEPVERPLTVIDLREEPEASRRAKIDQIILDEGRHQFDIAKGPLFRLSLLRVTDGESILVMVEHHLIHDGWTQGVLVREFMKIYTTLLKSEALPLPELSVQFADFASWQRQWMRGEVFEEQLSYWKRHLAGAPALIELPTDRRRPAIQSYRGAQQLLVIDAELAGALREASRREGGTLFMLFLATFKTLLYRYSNQSDVVVGTAIANRRWRELEGLTGMIINTLALRTDVSGNPSFSELLKRVRQTCLGAYANQDLPFERLVEELQPKRSLAHSPIFQVMLSFMDAPMLDVEIPGVTVTPVDAHNGSAKFDLNLTIVTPAEQAVGLGATPARKEITVICEYATDLFEKTTIIQFGAHFERLLKAVIEDPRVRIGHVPFLTESEQRQILIEWNRTRRDYGDVLHVQRLFEEQAARMPDNIAVICESEAVTYETLNRRANQLARHFGRLGADAGNVIGVYMERSIEMVVTILATLKAGCAYLPLDPDYPADRVSYMLEETQSRLLVTQSRLRDRAPAFQGQVALPDEYFSRISAESSENMAGFDSAETVAYIIYTSGTTGRPKGIMVPHRALSNHMLWMQEEFGFSEQDRILQKTPFSFDASVWEFYAPLLVGGTLVMARPQGHKDASYLIKTIIDNSITVLQLTPSLLQLLVDEPRFDRCLSLKRVFCGGEALTLQMKDKFFARLSTALCNLYGPSETTIDATFRQCEPRYKEEAVPIGRPIANTRTFILDPFFNPVPAGIPGELYIGGSSLSIGYYNQAAMTAERFAPDHLSGEAGSRLYRTGDRARYLPDGDIEYLGRLDTQVKIRGSRVEIGEIEATLRQHPSVRQAVVLLREDNPGDQRLVAYIVASSDRTVDEAGLREFIKGRLPAYMAPSNYVALEDMPLLPNGKIDRSSLPPPEQSVRRAETGPLPPRDEIEQALASIWSEVLNRNDFGVEDDFFDLGGHSLLAIKTISRVRERFATDIPVQKLFEGATIASLAECVRDLSSNVDGRTDSTIPAIPRLSRESRRVRGL